MITRYTFETVGVKATKRFKDANGNPRQITKRFEQTLNPYNQIEGKPKTRSQIMSECVRDRDEWLAIPAQPAK